MKAKPFLIPALVLLGTSISSTSCRKETVEAGKEQTAKAMEAAKANWKELSAQIRDQGKWKEQGRQVAGQAQAALSAVDLQPFISQLESLGVKHGTELTESLRTEAMAAVAKMDLAALRSQLEGLGDAISKNDFPQAKAWAEKLGTLLNSESITQSVRFLEIRSKEGVEAAQKAISDYLESAQLTVNEQDLYRNLQKSIASLTPEQTAEYLTFLVTLAIWMNVPGGNVHGALAPVVSMAMMPLVYNTLRVSFGLETVDMGEMYSTMLNIEAKAK